MFVESFNQSWVHNEKVYLNKGSDVELYQTLF